MYSTEKKDNTELLSNAYEDPDPPFADIFSKEPNHHMRELTASSDEMLTVLEFGSEKESTPWMDSNSKFRSHSIRTWPNGIAREQCSLLRAQDILSDGSSDILRAHALTDIQ